MTIYVILTLILLAVYLAGYAFEVLQGVDDLTWADHVLAVAVAALWSFGLALIWPV